MPVIQSIRQLEAARDEWNTLADRAGHALMRHEWFICAARAFHEDDELEVRTLQRNGRLSAIAPLVRRRSGFGRLEFIGAATLYEPCGFLYEDGEAHAELIDQVLRLKRPLLLQRLPAEAIEILGRRRRSLRHGCLMMRSTAQSLGIALGANAGFMANISSKLRYDLKRARTRAGEQGGVSFEALAPDPGEVDVLVDRLVAVEGSGWKGRRQSALRANERLHTFFRIYARISAEAGALRLFFLRIGDKMAAAQMAVQAYGRLWVLKIGYDEALSRCSPGLLLTSGAIDYSIAQGLTHYEFLGAAETWEERWRPEAREHGLLAFYPLTLRGCLGVSFDAAAAAWRRFKPVSHAANR